MTVFALRIVFYVLGWLLVALGLSVAVRQVIGGFETALLPCVLLVTTGLVFLAVGRTLGRHRRLFAVASVAAVAATSATVWVVVGEKPLPCADEITEAGSLAHIRPWIQRMGYSQAEIESFRVTNVTDFQESWPTYAFYFTGTKDGKAQGVLGVGNGCGIGHLEEGEPLAFTKVN